MARLKINFEKVVVGKIGQNSKTKKILRVSILRKAENNFHKHLNENSVRKFQETLKQMYQ